LEHSDFFHAKNRISAISEKLAHEWSMAYSVPKVSDSR